MRQRASQWELVNFRWENEGNAKLYKNVAMTPFSSNEILILAKNPDTSVPNAIIFNQDGLFCRNVGLGL